MSSVMPSLLSVQQARDIQTQILSQEKLITELVMALQCIADPKPSVTTGEVDRVLTGQEQAMLDNPVYLKQVARDALLRYDALNCRVDESQDRKWKVALIERIREFNHLLHNKAIHEWDLTFETGSAILFYGSRQRVEDFARMHNVVLKSFDYKEGGWVATFSSNPGDICLAAYPFEEIKVGMNVYASGYLFPAQVTAIYPEPERRGQAGKDGKMTGRIDVETRTGAKYLGIHHDHTTDFILVSEEEQPQP